MLVMPQRAVQRLDQPHDDAHRDRIEADEGLIVDQQLRVHHDRPRERDAPRHAAGEFGRTELRRAAQAHGLQLHQHQLAQHALGQARVLAHRKRDILEHRQVGEQRAVLEQHADALAQCVQLGAPQRGDLPAEHADLAGVGR